MFQLKTVTSHAQMSIPFLPPEGDVLDTHVDDLDSFKLFDEQNMLDYRMFDDDAETDSSDGSSCFEPDTTTSPPSKLKPPDPYPGIQPAQKEISHSQVAVFFAMFN